MRFRHASIPTPTHAEGTYSLRDGAFYPCSSAIEFPKSSIFLTGSDLQQGLMMLLCSYGDGSTWCCSTVCFQMARFAIDHSKI